MLSQAVTSPERLPPDAPAVARNGFQTVTMRVAATARPRGSCHRPSGREMQHPEREEHPIATRPKTRPSSMRQGRRPGSWLAVAPIATAAPPSLTLPLKGGGDFGVPPRNPAPSRSRRGERRDWRLRDPATIFTLPLRWEGGGGGDRRNGGGEGVVTPSPTSARPSLLHHLLGCRRRPRRGW